MALWGTLKDKFQDFWLAIWVDYVVVPYSKYDLKQPLQFPLFFLVFPLLTLLVALFRAREEDRTRTRTALQALLTILTPTCSLWPTRYTKLAKCLGSVPNPRISVPLETIIEDTIDGVIEFRDPINDLAELIGPGLKVYGWTICLKLEWRWWIEVFRWRITAKPKKMPGCSSEGPPDSRAVSMERTKLIVLTSSLPLGLFLSPFASISPTSGPRICLDCLPPGVIPSLISGSKVTLEFTSFSPYLRTLSTAQILSAVPFMFSEGLPRRPQSLLTVLERLTFSHDDSNLAVTSVLNVSADYERALTRLYDLISGEQETRNMWVKTRGIRSWRQDLFLMALEVALVRRGWIERWAVEVSVK
ncbi:hypothetical protein BU15DRAFT_58455 [Melanogaster broomeanus]|nr:hypothetical protein BU15DRAFT_58455 [Melanogaster broomeanus]